MLDKEIEDIAKKAYESKQVLLTSNPDPWNKVNQNYKNFIKALTVEIIKEYKNLKENK